MGHPAQVPIAQPCSQPQASRTRYLVPNSCPAPQALMHKPLVGQNPWPRPRRGTSSQVSVLVPSPSQPLGEELGPAKSQGHLSSPATHKRVADCWRTSCLNTLNCSRGQWESQHSTEVHKKQNHCVVQLGHSEPHSPLRRDPRPPCFGD